MLAWFSANLVNIALTAAVALIVGLLIFVMVRDKKAGKSSCGGRLRRMCFLRRLQRLRRLPFGKARRRREKPKRHPGQCSLTAEPRRAADHAALRGFLHGTTASEVLS